MTVVHENDCVKCNKSLEKKTCSSVHHGEMKADGAIYQPNEYEQRKSKLSVILTITCRRSIPLS